MQNVFKVRSSKKSSRKYVVVGAVVLVEKEVDKSIAVSLPINAPINYLILD